MNPRRLYLVIQMCLLGLWGAGLAIWLFVRAPDGSSSDRILHDAILVGRVEEVIHQAAAAVQDQAAIVAKRAPWDLDAGRARLKWVQASAQRLDHELDLQKSWIPGTEAAALLEQSRQLAVEALDLALPDSTDSGAAAPAAELEGAAAAERALANTPVEVARLLSGRATQLIDQSTSFRASVHGAITEGLLARGTLVGRTTSEWLLFLLTIAALTGAGILRHARSRARLPLEELERTELKLLANSDRLAAMRKCNERVRDLLDLGDSLCRGGKT